MSSKDRFTELMSKVLDDEMSDEEIVELHAILHAEPSLRSEMVDHLLLDTLLGENLGQEPLTALIDLVGDSTNTIIGPALSTAESHDHPADITASPARSWPWMTGYIVLAASILIAVFFFFMQSNQEAYASASQVIQAAIHTHAAPIERIYVVEVKRGDPSKIKFEFPRDVRVATQGDRFWVQMRGLREWVWGRNEQGAIWITLGPSRAVVVNPEEIGVSLCHISDLCTLNLETLLQNLLKHCRLEMSDGPANTTIIVATPRPQWTGRPLRRATIEVDRETKAIRKLIIEREFEIASSVTTFTLVDSRLADESLYGPEGHLNEPYTVFSTETNAERRREFITNWFGPISDQWMQTKPR